jgi:hypothetical protein
MLISVVSNSRRDTRQINGEAVRRLLAFVGRAYDMPSGKQPLGKKGGSELLGDFKISAQARGLGCRPLFGRLFREAYLLGRYRPSVTYLAAARTRQRDRH